MTNDGRWKCAPRRRPFVRLFACLVLVVALVALLAPATGVAQSDVSVRWLEFNVDLDVQSNGIVHVTETQVIRFNDGPYRRAFAEIPLARVDSIQNVIVSEIDADGNRIDYRRVNNSSTRAGTYTDSEQGGVLAIDYYFSSAEAETRTFVLEYDLIGAVRVYDELDPPNLQLWWNAIAEDTTEVAPVDSATVTVTLPEPVDPSTVQILREDGGLSSDPESYTEDWRTFTWSARNLTNGESLEVRLQFPVILEIEKPVWQQADDDRREAAEESQARSDLYNLIFGAIGILLAVVGSLLLYGIWFTRGRDPQVGLIVDFLPAPPDDSPPGTVGVLVDEVAEERDLVATMVDLSRRGVFRIEDRSDEVKPDLELTMLAPNIEMSELERSLTNDLFDNQLTEGKSVRIGEHALSNEEAILKGLYNDLVARGFYTRSPDFTRGRYRMAGTVLIVAAVLIYCVAMAEFRFALLFLPFLVVGILGFVLRWQSRHMPRRTLEGAEAAAKWRAFRTYLRDIQKYEKLEESTAIFERYLPFAIAFGIEKSWVEKFARANAPEPTWMGPGGTVIVINDRGERRQSPRSGGGGLFDWTDPGRSGSGGSSQDRGGSGGGLQDWSDSSAKSLQDSSDGLASMLNSASRSFGGFGGGSKGSRSSGSFGSRGGSRGFSGGGSRGGSGGGGRRGFG